MENKVKFKLKPVCISYDLAEAIYNLISKKAHVL